MLLELQTATLIINNLSHLIFGVLYLGIFATAGAFFLWNKGLEYLDASHASLFFFFQPLVGSILGWFFLSEKITLRFYIGSVFILIGVVLTTIKKADLRQLKPKHNL